MNCKNLETIVQELNTYSAKVSQEQVHMLAEACVKANRIFIGGAGRSGFAARGFANRLMHLGLTSYFVGEPTAPSIQAGDLLIIGLGFGIPLLKWLRKRKKEIEQSVKAAPPPAQEQTAS